MVISGLIEEIIFRNGENNYTVLLLNCNGEFVTAVGKFPLISEGEYVELTGNFTAHSKYGEQFSVSGIKLKPPTTDEGIVRYLSSGLIKGVGPITAGNIVKKFGGSTFDIMEFNPSRLAEIRGISEKKAMEIGEAYNDVKKMQNAVMLMQNYNISTNLAIKIYNYYGSKTEHILKNNPYKLVEDVDGIGFYTADKIARNMGLAEDSTFRFRAGILHSLKEFCDKNGNTYVTKSNIIDSVCELLRLNSDKYIEIIERVVSDLAADDYVKIFEKDNDIGIALTKYYNLEKIVGATLKLYSMNEINLPLNITEEIDMYEKLNKISMHEKQKEAIEMAVSSGVSVITGGPGTGKTTIIKCVLQLFKSLHKKVKLLAPTGRAAKRLNESCDEDASTIHRALEVDFSNPGLFYYNNLNKLPYDVVIVDEVSMVDIQLMYYLIRALKRGTQIVLVGDKDQLPSVGAGNVLKDILDSGVIPTVALTHIYRQNEGLIINNAHLINEGKMPIINNASKDFFFAEKEETEDALNTIISMCIERIPKFLDIDSSKVQVLAPMKAGLCGIDNLNKSLQERLNPPGETKPEMTTDRYTYRVGDRVMQTSNNYERVWVKDGAEGSGVFNGDIGVVSRVDLGEMEITIDFEDGRIARYNKGDLNEITLSYAITIHKSQGSEFDVVVMPVLGGPPMLLTKNLLYTGVTRAKKMVVLVGNKPSIARMVKNNHTQKRFTLLYDFLTNDELF